MKINRTSPVRAALLASALFSVIPTVSGAIIIQPVYDATFLADPALQTTVNNAISIYASRLGNNILIPINFVFSTTISGAQSSAGSFPVAYGTYRGALANNITTANDATAVANLITGTNDPVINGTIVDVNTALGFALGLNLAQASYGTVTFQTSLYQSNPAGFLGVIQHEVNEVLGTASNLPNANPPGTGLALPTTIAPADLFRYGTTAARNFTTNIPNDPADRAFFRLSPGGTNLQEFNNLPNGGDYADWAGTGTNGFAFAPQDQAGDASVFTSMSISTAELDMLDVIGYNLIPVPEPGTVATLASVGFGWIAFHRRRREKVAAR
ncbi:MAG: NF038122 family metalloprotease [Chthoniobacteraceae bacterium]